MCNKLMGFTRLDAVRVNWYTLRDDIHVRCISTACRVPVACIMHVKRWLIIIIHIIVF